MEAAGTAQKGGVAMAKFLLLVALAAMTLHAAPALAAVIGTSSLDTHDATNETPYSGPVFPATLEPGQLYLVTVSGTLSAWAAGVWGPWTGDNATNVCAGQAEEWPQSESSGTVNGAVGIDAEYLFAWVDGSPALCPGGAPIGPAPLHAGALELSLDAGTTWQHVEPIDRAYNPDHSYQYLVAGPEAAALLGVRYRDSWTSDNYGTLSVTVEATDGRSFVTGGGAITGTSGVEADFGLKGKIHRGAFRGSLTYQENGGVAIEADALTGVLVLSGTGTAYLTGYASVNGDPGHPFVLIVQDNGNPGAGSDTFRLDVDGLTVAAGTLSDGNVKIHRTYIAGS